MESVTAANIKSSKDKNFQLGDIGGPGMDLSMLGQNIGDAAKAGLLAGEVSKAAAAKNQAEFEKLAAENQAVASENGDFLNERVIDAISNGSNQLQDITNQFLKGTMTNSNYLIQKNNIIEGQKQLDTFIKAYAEEEKLAAERQALGSLNENTELPIGSNLDAFNQSRLGAAAQLKGHEMKYTADGKMMFYKKGSKSLTDIVSMPAALNGLIQEYKNFDLDENAAKTAQYIKPVTEVEGKGRIKTIEDAMQNPDVAKYIEDEWAQITGDSENTLSIITSQGVPPPAGFSKWEYTTDPGVAAVNENMLLVTIDPTTNRYVAYDDSNEEAYEAFAGQGYDDSAMTTASDRFKKAKEDAFELYKRNVGTKLGYKETYLAPVAPRAKTKDEINAGLSKAKTVDLANRLKRLFSSNSLGDINSVSEELGGMLIVGEQGPNKKTSLQEITRSDDGVTIVKRILTTDPTTSRQTVSRAEVFYPFEGKSEYDFVRGIQSLFSENISQIEGVNLNKDRSQTAVQLGNGITGGFTQQFGSSGDTPDYNEIGSVVIDGIKQKPAIPLSSYVPDEFRSELTKLIQNISTKSSEHQLDISKMRVGLLDENEQTYTYTNGSQLQGAMIMPLEFTYKGKDYKVEIPIDTKRTNEILANDITSINTIMETIYNTARNNGTMDVNELKKDGLRVVVSGGGNNNDNQQGTTR